VRYIRDSEMGPVLRCRCGWEGPQCDLKISEDDDVSCPRCGAGFVGWPVRHPRLKK